MLPVLEVQLLVEVGVRLRRVGELVGTALVAADAVPVAAVRGQHVIEVGCPELAHRLVNQQPQVVVLGLEELWANVVLVLGEVEGFAPVVALQRNLVDGAEELLHLVLVVAVGVWPDPAFHDHGHVPPYLGDPHGELDVAENQLAAAGHVCLGQLVEHHLGKLLDLLVFQAPHERRQEHGVVHEALSAAEVGLPRRQHLDAVEYGHLGLLGRPRDAASVPAAVRQQPIVEEVPEVPVLAERPCAEVLQGVDVDVSLVVGRRQLRVHQQQVLLLAQHVSLLLVHRLRVWLEVGVLLGLEAVPHVDLVRVVERSPDPGEEVPVDLELRYLVAPLKKYVVCDLPHHGPRHVSGTC